MIYKVSNDVYMRFWSECTIRATCFLAFPASVTETLPDRPCLQAILEYFTFPSWKESSEILRIYLISATLNSVKEIRAIIQVNSILISLNSWYIRDDS